MFANGQWANARVSRVARISSRRDALFNRTSRANAALMPRPATFFEVQGGRQRSQKLVHILRRRLNIVNLSQSIAVRRLQDLFYQPDGLTNQTVLGRSACRMTLAK